MYCRPNQTEVKNINKASVGSWDSTDLNRYPIDGCVYIIHRGVYYVVSTSKKDAGNFGDFEDVYKNKPF